jgi:hypothetical protein
MCHCGSWTWPRQPRRVVQMSRVWCHQISSDRSDSAKETFWTLADIPIKSRIQSIQCKSNCPVRYLLVQTGIHGIVNYSDGSIASRPRRQGDPIGPHIFIILHLIDQFPMFSLVCQTRILTHRKARRKSCGSTRWVFQQIIKHQKPYAFKLHRYKHHFKGPRISDDIWTERSVEIMHNSICGDEWWCVWS